MENQPAGDYVRVADVEISSVRSERSGFLLEGRGADRADYRLELHLDMPVDERTRAVLSEMLAQSEWRAWRRSPQPFPRRGGSGHKLRTKTG